MSRTNQPEPGLAPGFLVAPNAPARGKGALQLTSGHGWRRDDSDFVAFCFSKPEDADAFVKRFGGERLPMPPR
jgi:hypothetical protein